jgi:hypothetical protein
MDYAGFVKREYIFGENEVGMAFGCIWLERDA